MSGSDLSREPRRLDFVVVQCSSGLRRCCSYSLEQQSGSHLPSLTAMRCRRAFGQRGRTVSGLHLAVLQQRADGVTAERRPLKSRHDRNC
jgi:hypothetical protein